MIAQYKGLLFCIPMVLLLIPTAVQPITGINGFKYQASDDSGNVIHSSFVRDFAAMGSFSFNPHAQFLVHSAE